MSRRARVALVVGGVVLLLAAVAGAYLAGRSSKPSPASSASTSSSTTTSTESVAPKPALKAPPPDLADFVPAPQRVLSVTQMNLEPAIPPAVVVLSIAPSTGSYPPPFETIRVLAWDVYAKRWTVVFDTATVTRSGLFETYPLDAPDALYDVNIVPSTTPLPAGTPGPFATLVNAKVAAVADDPGGGADLVFFGGDGESGLGAGETGIVHFSNGTMSIVWSYSDRYLSGFQVVGTAPHQQVQYNAYWETVSDPGCCPSRKFQFVVGRLPVAASGDYVDFSVVKDTRSWLGAWIVPNSSVGNVGEVLDITPGSPAAGVLKPGDVLESVVGARSPGTNLLGPAVVDEVAEQPAGSRVTLDIEREGKPMQVVVVLGSRDNKAAVNGQTPSPGYLDVTGSSMTAELASQDSLPNVPGVLIDTVTSGGAAASAGLAQGDIIENMGDYATPTLAELTLAEVQAGTSAPVPVQYINPQGVQHTVSVTLGTPPSGDPIFDLAYV